MRGKRRSPERSFPQTRVGVLDSGEVGRRLASGFASRRHAVMIGSRDPDKPELGEWPGAGGAGIESGTFAETAAHGELLVLAVLGTAAGQGIGDAGAENFSGKVVIDAMNPLDFSEGSPRSSRSAVRTRSGSRFSACRRTPRS